MAQKLIAAISVAVLIAQPLVTFHIGIETGGPQLRALLTRWGLSIRYFLATFVVMPAIATALGAFGILPKTIWVGLALMSIAPPAPPATLRLKKMGNRDVGLAWQAEAFLISAVTIPLTITIVQSMGLVGTNLNLTWGPVLERSLTFFAVPMFLGLLARRYLPAVADALVKPVGVLANVALLVLVVLVLIVAVPIILKFHIASIAIVIGFVALAVVVGHIFGGPGKDTRITLAAMLAARFPVPALVLAQANNATKMVLPVVLIYILAGTLLVPLYARLAPRSSRHRA